MFTPAPANGIFAWGSASPWTASRSGWIGRAAAALVLAILLAGTTTAERAGAAPTDGPADAAATGTALLPGVAEGDIDGFWAGRFAAAGYGYATPAVIGFDAPIATACGTVQPADYVAFYCTVDGAVYFSTPRTKRQTAIYGDAAWINIIAHEWGHHVQAMLGLNPEWRLLNDVQGIEQEATCLEGVYIADAAARGLIGEATIGDMMGMFNGDEEHGTSEQLVAAFTAGFEDGFAGCGVGLPDADATSSGTIATTGDAADRDAVTGDAPSVSIAPGSMVRVTTAGDNLRTSPSTDAAVRATLGWTGTCW